MDEKKLKVKQLFMTYTMPQQRLVI